MAMLLPNYSPIRAFIKINVFVFACLIIGCAVFGQPIIPIVSKGSRPTIDIAKVPASAYKANRLNLKFQPQFRYNLEKIKTDASGNVLFGIALVDSLNKKYHLAKITSLFGCILQDGELYKQHQSWGFDLWYSVSFDGKVNVKEVLQAYKSTGAFDVVEPVYKAAIQYNPPPPLVPNDPTFHYQWNLNNTGQYNGMAGKDISMLKAWSITTGDPDVIVSVHDNAINIHHPDLSQNIAVGFSHNFLDNNDSLTLNSSHGSHCAGIIGAVNNNGEGISGIAGGDGTTASGIRLMSCETFGPNDTSGGFAESLVYAADHGTSISNNSWGYDEPDVYEEAVLDAIDYFCNNGGGKVLNGGVVVFAAGNNGKQWRIYPAGYERVISVAATGNQDKKASYSNYGNWLSLSAPGGEGYMEGGIFSTDNTSYSSGSGTSFAAPHVVGVAALVSSVLKGKASGSDVREILLSTTDNNYPQNPSFPNMLGTGRLNAYSALQKAQSFLNKTINPITNFNASYQCNNFNVNWTNSSNNTVIVAYNNNSNFGTLIDGSPYNVGDSLLGGGVIVYKGNGSNFNFPIVNAENQYSFKLWIAEGSKYSFAKMAESFAKPIIKKAGINALMQTFDYPPLYPTKLWHGTNTKYDFSSWIHTANDTSSTGAGDDYSMCLYNYQLNTVLGAVDTLTSPQLRIKGADSVALTFWHAYQYRNRQHTYSDSLEVLVSSDCGNNSTSVWKKGGAELATVADSADKKFYPFGGIRKWKKDVVDLSAFSNAENIVIGFRGYNGKGNNLFLDNIAVSVLYKTDASILNVYAANDSACQNEGKVKVILGNKGLNSIKSCNFGYQIDGGIINVVHFSNNIVANDSAIVNLSLQASVGVHLLKVFSFLPNNTVDNYTLNDTLITSFTILPIDTLPLSASFENNLLSSEGWQVTSQIGNNFSWFRTNIASSKGNASVYAQNYVYTDYGLYQDLVSPTVNITHQIDSLFLLFDVAAAIQADSVNLARIDTLQIDMTIDCGQSWTTIYKKWGDKLQTAMPMYTEFIPTATEWRTDSISLAGKATAGDQIRFRFRNIENGSNNIYLDNVRVFGKTLNTNLQEKGLLVYPNPFKNNLTIQHYLPPINLQTLTLLDTRGRKVRTIQYKGTAAATQTINLIGLQAGYYTLELVYTDKRVIKKLIKIDK